MLDGFCARFSEEYQQHLSAHVKCGQKGCNDQDPVGWREKKLLFEQDLILGPESRKGEYISQYENLDDTYENLLKYSVEGVKDPEREKIYDHLSISVIELADLALQDAYINTSDQYIYQLKRKIEFESKQIKEEAIDSIEDLAFDKELSEVLKESIEAETDQNEDPFEDDCPSGECSDCRDPDGDGYGDKMWLHPNMPGCLGLDCDESDPT